MRNASLLKKPAMTLALAVLLGSAPSHGAASSMDQVLDQIVERERGLLQRLQEYRPLVETYLQSVRPDGILGEIPIRDRYFLGRLDLGGEAGWGKSKNKPKTNEMVDLYHYSASANPDGFARMLTLDTAAFDRQSYDFSFVRREFLGEVRTLIFDVRPKKSKSGKPGRFTGRIWVEDEGYNIVRYNGVHGSIFRTTLHFDSWRINVGPGIWLPAYVYTEEPDRPGGDPKLKHKGQTRIWGYDIKRRSSDEEFTKVLVDAPLTRDESEVPGQVSPVESHRAWEREAEDNVLRRLNRAGLLAPAGEVSQVLETVVSNLEVTNELDIYPPVRCRVLLTTPLESFTVGNTIVLSRGLIDVLPDEASLAMVLAHELGHIVVGHRLDTKYAFSDQMLVDDKQALELFHFERDAQEEMEADQQAVKLLTSSPYNDKLANAGLFLKLLSASSQRLSTLIEPHFGNRPGMKEQLARLSTIVNASPELDPLALDQIPALPLGGRVKVNPWTAHAELMKNKREAPRAAREKMPFHITPLMPYLVRHDGKGAQPEKQVGEAADPDATPANGVKEKRSAS